MKTKLPEINDCERCLKALEEYLKRLDEILDRMAKRHGVSKDILYEQIELNDNYFLEEWQDEVEEVEAKIESEMGVEIEHEEHIIQVRKGSCYLEVTL